MNQRVFSLVVGLLLAVGVFATACSGLASSGARPTPTPFAVPSATAIIGATPEAAVEQSPTPLAITTPVPSGPTQALVPTSIAPPVAAPTNAPGPRPAAGSTSVPSAGTTPVPATACTNVATFVTDVTVPDNTVVSPGQAFSKTWRMRNRGTCTWGNTYTFAFVSGEAMTSTPIVPVPDTAPGATVDVQVAMTAPATAGSVRGNWQLKAPNGTPFGPQVWVTIRTGSASAAPTLAPATGNTGTNCTNVASFVTDVTVPDGTRVAPGQAFAKTWRLLNRGTCTWGQGYMFASVSGQALSTVANIPVPNTAPGAMVDLSVPMISSVTAGTFHNFWQLHARSGTPFGPQVWVLINVTSQ